MKITAVVFTAQNIFLALSSISVARAQPWCEEDEGCIGELKACTEAPDNCCEGFECHGYNFFKRCQETPFCLGEWYACNPEPGEDDEAMECCSGLVCVATHNGLAECQRPSSRTVELPGFNIEEEKPTEPPVPTKTFVCEAPVIHSAQLTGDPHFRTFDGLTYDCQGVGEHIVFKTAETSRQVQGRFTRVQNMDVSVTHGIAMQDEGGATVPKVQVSIPIDADEETDDFTILGGKGCKLQLFVDGEQHTLKTGVSYESDEVTVSLAGNEVTTLYKSGFKIKVNMGYWNGCLLNTYLSVPTCEMDSITGLLGDADGNANNDWITKTGERVDIPSGSTDRRRKPAYDWCVPNWCIVNQKESIFHYSEVGYDFGYYSRCALEYGTSLVEFIEDLPADIVKRCDGNMGCMIDALADDADTVEAAIRTVAINEFELKEDDPNFCTAKDGDCSGGNPCCDGLNCVHFSPFEHQCKKGITKLTELKPQCNPFEGGYCDEVKCCGDMVCVEKNGDNNKKKLWLCEKPAECVAERKRCNADTDCCNGMTCADPKKGKEGKRKVCLNLPKISKKNEICFPGQGCENGLTCEDGNCEEDKPLKWGKKCFAKNWAKEKKCDKGLVCMPFKNRMVCGDPGLKKDVKTLKKNAVCNIGDTTALCLQGHSCQKPLEKKQVEKLIKKYGKAKAEKIGQCIKKGAEEAIKEYREKKGKKLQQRTVAVEIPKPDKCVLKRGKELLKYEPNFPEGRPDVYIEVEITDGRRFQFYPKDYPNYKGGEIPVADKKVYQILYDEQEKLGGRGFKLRYVSKNGAGAWNSCKYSPIAFDLNGSGEIEHITNEAGFMIDITGDGDEEHLREWFAPTEGILVDFKGQDVTEVTGHHLMGDMGGKYTDGFDKLETYDDNQDGKISGDELDGLRLWMDKNSNLLIDDGELKDFSDYGIVALSTTHDDLKSYAELEGDGKMLMQDLWFNAFRRTRKH